MLLAKQKRYYYNAETNRFERVRLGWKILVLRGLGLLSAVIVSSGVIVALAFQFLGSPKERNMKAELEQLKETYAFVHHHLFQQHQRLKALEERDNDVYRTIFESSPIPEEWRAGDSSLHWEKAFTYKSADQLVNEIRHKIAALEHRMAVQERSLDTLEKMVKSKEEMLMAIPAIQPVANKNLKGLVSGFGIRIDPLYKTPKMHTGLDFAAPVGTPVYATGNGRVIKADRDHGGYGNHVVIDHGYGYQTLMAHLVKIKVRKNQHVRRGEVIGWVGNTGKSTGPHCHYEVIRNGTKLNPVHYFFQDLSPQEYEKILELAAANNQSLD